MLEMESMESKEDVQSTGVPQSVLLLCLAVTRVMTRVTSTSALFLISLETAAAKTASQQQNEEVGPPPASLIRLRSLERIIPPAVLWVIAID